jgi:hypothetical protein
MIGASPDMRHAGATGMTIIQVIETANQFAPRPVAV